MVRYLLVAVALAVSLSGCAQQSDVFPDLGDNISSPTSMWIDVASDRLYLVNSNDKVLYDSTQGNFQVYDITDPLAPVLLGTAPTLSFTGQVYFDPATMLAWAPNRYSQNVNVETGLLYKFDVNEAGAGFLSYTESVIQTDSFGMECCYPAGRAWITSSWQDGDDPVYQYVDLGGDLTPGEMPLSTTLDGGSQLNTAQATYEVLAGPQAFLSRLYGGIMVINLDKAGEADAVPMDYFINDIEQPRGLAHDGRYLYVAGEGSNDDGDWIPYLLILDVSTLTPRADNTTTMELDKDGDDLLVAMIQVGNYPQEVLVTADYAFVTNQNDNTVSVISKAGRNVVTTIDVGRQPVTMSLYTTLAGEEKYVYVGNMYDNTFSIIDIPTLAVVATYP
ncbi:MAG TPA: hypothetical protein PLY45_02915 [bacterium]|nr:hypothetical protein [bacterium]